jgi:hypothetical protein
MRNTTGREVKLASLRSELSAVIEQLRQGTSFRGLEVDIALKHLEHALAELDAVLAREGDPWTI